MDFNDNAVALELKRIVMGLKTDYLYRLFEAVKSEIASRNSSPQ
jgi:hypothetical protein